MTIILLILYYINYCYFHHFCMYIEWIFVNWIEIKANLLIFLSISENIYFYSIDKPSLLILFINQYDMENLYEIYNTQ
jgi:hypothetical protein